MKHGEPTTPIDTESLRIGMFIHLDVGWMSHPFPLSSFKIATREQIATIRSLGLKRVRWSPEQSDAEEPALRLVSPGHTEAGGLQPSQPAALEAESDEARARRERRESLAAQRAALNLCERQFAEAARENRLIVDQVPNAPAAAGEKAAALSRAFVDKLLGDGDVSIRLLNEAAGDKASTHALNVAVISLLMGRNFGFSEGDLLDLGVGALLHDIGKIDLPDRVRHREDHFSASEIKYYEEHVAHGVTHARKMGLSSGALLVIAQHHEHADGSGFPRKVSSDRMTPAARVVALINRYDNLCNPTLPSKALTPHEALSMLFAQGKSKFDTAILGAFIKMMGVYPPGSVVQLTDDRYAIVVGVNSSRPLKPRVLVHDARVPSDEALVIDLEDSPQLGIRRSLKPLALPRESLDYLSPRQRVCYFFEPSRPVEAVA